MKRDDRRQEIMDMLVENGEVGLDDLAERFAVSKMTIHRDLDDLEAAGLLRKLRGGATIQAGTQFESDFQFRERQGADAKAAMAAKAIDLIEPGMTVMINDGSMAAVLGERLREKRPLTVITNNATVMEKLKSESGITLIGLGGTYTAKFNAYLGMVTEDTIARLRADIAFISTPAVAGTQVFHMDDTVVRSKRAMMNAAQKVCLMVNHTRFGQSALHRLADLSEFDHIITDARPGTTEVTELDAAGVTLTIASEQELTHD